MQQLLPSVRSDHMPGLDELRDGRSTRRGGTSGARPWVMANMVMGLDGAFSVEGRSAGLSSDADRTFFHRLRAVSDVILVGAGTARVENYRRPSNAGDALAWREAKGLGAAARLAMVSRSGRLPLEMAAMQGPGEVPLLFHPGAASVAYDTTQVEQRVCGETEVGLADVLQALHAEGAELVLTEGGPTLLGALHEADLLDEVFITLAPLMVGGRHTGLLGDATAEPRDYDLHRLLEADGSLFLNYRRVRD